MPHACRGVASCWCSGRGSHLHVTTCVTGGGEQENCAAVVRLVDSLLHMSCTQQSPQSYRIVQGYARHMVAWSHTT